MQPTALRVEVCDTRAGMGAAAAAQVAGRINQILENQAFVNIVFAAAPSQNEFLQALQTAAVDWRRVRAFHMDEYIGLDRDATQGFGHYLRQRLFDKVHLAEVYYLDGNAADTEQECRRYGALLQQFPTDIVCMGIGENGHIAFNDPPVADFSDPFLVKPVELDPLCRQQQVNDGCFSALDAVPLRALTLTIPALMAAGFLYCIVPGSSKATAVFNTLNKEIKEEYPATIIRTHPHAVLFLDKASAQLLCFSKY
jgi:glucosamine-6-phosphate deaminase